MSRRRGPHDSYAAWGAYRIEREMVKDFKDWQIEAKEDREVSEYWDLPRLERTLRAFVLSLDYDLHKSWECNEEDGGDDYPLLVQAFIEDWEAAK